MTTLDSAGSIAGYFDCPWPAECGGPRRQKVASSPGLALGPQERLGSVIRSTGGWAVMLVRRGPGELYLLCGASLAEGELPPVHRSSGPSSGWVEQVDPATLQTLRRSDGLPSGGWLWCGALAAHENGDLYAVNGRNVFRLDPHCGLLAQRELPADAPHNGLVILSDGNLVVRNLGFRRGDKAQFVLLDPDLEPMGEPLDLPERCMGRISSDRSTSGEFLYSTTPDQVFRIRYSTGALELDTSWLRSYAVEGGGQSDAWDTSIADDSVWLMDMGRPPNWMRPGSAPQRAFRFGLDPAAAMDIVEDLDAPFAWNPGPPLYDPIRKILVHYDSLNGGVSAHRFESGADPQRLWRRDYRNYMQMMVYADTGELVLEDATWPTRFGGDEDRSEAVLVSIETGEELGRAKTGAPSLGMFPTPGFDRDFYLASIPGEITRVFVEETGSDE